MFRTSMLLLGTFLAASTTAQAAPTSSRPAMLIHGNYCGPGNNAPLAPVDALDAACARHDACTPDDALPSKACNIRLQVEADLLARDPSQSEGMRMLAGIVATAAAMMPFETADAKARQPASRERGSKEPGRAVWTSSANRN